MRRWEDVKMFEDVYNRPPPLEEPFAQTLPGEKNKCCLLITIAAINTSEILAICNPVIHIYIYTYVYAHVHFIWFHSVSFYSKWILFHSIPLRCVLWARSLISFPFFVAHTSNQIVKLSLVPACLAEVKPYKPVIEFEPSSYNQIPQDFRSVVISSLNLG